MKIITPQLFFILLLPCMINAQDELPPVYMITTDTAYKLELGNNHWQILDDKEGKWTIENVSNSPLVEQFHYYPAVQFPNAVTATTHWLRYRLKNTMNTTANLSFITGSQQSDFYILGIDSTARHFVTGYGYPWSKKNGFKKANAIPFMLQPGELVTVYQKRYNEIPDSLSAGLKIRLMGTQNLKDAELKDYQDNYIPGASVFSTFAAGLLIMAALYNFLIYWSGKDKVYLYFSLFLFIASLQYAPNFTQLIFDDNIRFTNAMTIIVSLWPVSFLFFIRHYFSLYEKNRRWARFMTGASWFLIAVTIVIGVYRNYYYTILISWVGILNFIYSLLLIVTAIICLRKSGRAGKIFFIAITPFVIVFCFALIYIKLILKADPTDSFMHITDFAAVLSVVWMTMVFSSFLFRRYGQQQKQLLEVELEKEKLAREKETERNELIAAQKIDLEKQVLARTADLNQSLEELKATQSQLIQSEKMASLGELTAGIAHEIQNPLNFVNNFSDVNTELIDELQQEAAKGNMDEVKLIANDIKENESKINHHGKRADAIVKGMLQHSRSSSGHKELADINKLADEYLRLAYHGLRAKDKSFNATLNTDFDEAIGKINIVPQDIGRVLLNLYNNAFYAVSSPPVPNGREKAAPKHGYEPTVWVSTKKLNDRILISVRDNGGGVSPAIIDKIFQPFFTTKPTGQGTGLGLSLSYDIIKAHGGEIKVESIENEGTTFIVQLKSV